MRKALFLAFFSLISFTQPSLAWYDQYDMSNPPPKGKSRSIDTSYKEIAEQVGSAVSVVSHGVKAVKTFRELFKDFDWKKFDVDKWLEAYSELKDFVSSIKFPPQFSVGLPGSFEIDGVEVSGSGMTGGLDSTGQYVVGVDPKNPSVELRNLRVDKHEGKEMLFVVKEGSKKLKDMVSNDVAIMSSPSQKVSADGREYAINLRNQYLTYSVTSFGNLPFGKEFASTVPDFLKDEYSFVVSKAMVRDAYLKSFQRRLQIHYQAILVLQKVIDKYCSVPLESSLESCEDAYSKRSSGGDILSVAFESRGACCGVCGKALAQAKKNFSAIKGAEKNILHRISEAEDHVVKTISYQECLTRNAIRQEMTALRNANKMFACLSLRLQLRRLLIELDSLEAQVGSFGAVASILQNEEYNNFNRDYQKAVERGLDVPITVKPKQ